MTDRSKLLALAEASSASERLMDFITDKPDWQIPEPKAVVSIETATASAMVYAKERADAEAAAMRQFVSLVASLTLSDEMAPDTPCEDAWMTMDGLIRRARGLADVGEVGRD